MKSKKCLQRQVFSNTVSAVFSVRLLTFKNIPLEGKLKKKKRKCVLVIFILFKCQNYLC